MLYFTRILLIAATQENNINAIHIFRQLILFTMVVANLRGKNIFITNILSWSIFSDIRPNANHNAVEMIVHYYYYYHYCVFNGAGIVNSVSLLILGIYY